MGTILFKLGILLLAIAASKENEVQQNDSLPLLGQFVIVHGTYLMGFDENDGTLMVENVDFDIAGIAYDTAHQRAFIASNSHQKIYEMRLFRLQSQRKTVAATSGNARSLFLHANDARETFLYWIETSDENSTIFRIKVTSSTEDGPDHDFGMAKPYPWLKYGGFECPIALYVNEDNKIDAWTDRPSICSLKNAQVFRVGNRLVKAFTVDDGELGVFIDAIDGQAPQIEFNPRSFLSLFINNADRVYALSSDTKEIQELSIASFTAQRTIGRIGAAILNDPEHSTFLIATDGLATPSDYEPCSATAACEHFCYRTLMGPKCAECISEDGGTRQTECLRFNVDVDKSSGVDPFAEPHPDTQDFEFTTTTNQIRENSGGPTDRAAPTGSYFPYWLSAIGVVGIVAGLFYLNRTRIIKCFRNYHLV